MNIRPLHLATRADITEMAHAAAERSEPSAQANPFEPSTPNHRAFEVDYFEHRMGELAGRSAEKFHVPELVD